MTWSVTNFIEFCKAHKWKMEKAVSSKGIEFYGVVIDCPKGHGEALKSGYPNHRWMADQYMKSPAMVMLWRDRKYNIPLNPHVLMNFKESQFIDAHSGDAQNVINGPFKSIPKSLKKILKKICPGSIRGDAIWNISFGCSAPLPPILWQLSPFVKAAA